MSLIKLKTSCGTIEGVVEENYHSFLGIRYAEANRFELPYEVTKWDGVYEAKYYGPACIQRRTYTPETDDSFYYREFRKGLDFTYSEDCQFLNIWTPKNTTNCPVILYIHGGAFQGGAGNELPFDGKHFAQKGVIFVTCNYRLGALGFVSIDTSAEKIANLGLYDQLTALKWLYHNIEFFGGNPGNITLMGQSAGAMSIQQLVTSPLAKPYIAKAIMTSGGGLGSNFAKPKPIADVSSFWENLRQLLSSQGKDWKTIPAKELLDTISQRLTDVPNAIDYISPCVDGQLLPYQYEELLEECFEAEIPYLLGTTKDDMLADVLLEMSNDWRKRRNRKKGGSAFQFYLARNLPGDAAGTWHSSDLWYTIGNLEKCWRPFTDWDYTISRTLQSYIVHFVKTGNPNQADLESWGTDDDKVLVINDEEITYTKLEEEM